MTWMTEKLRQNSSIYEIGAVLADSWPVHKPVLRSLSLEIQCLCVCVGGSTFCSWSNSPRVNERGVLAAGKRERSSTLFIRMCCQHSYTKLVENRQSCNGRLKPSRTKSKLVLHPVETSLQSSLQSGYT